MSIYSWNLNNFWYAKQMDFCCLLILSDNALVGHVTSDINMSLSEGRVLAPGVNLSLEPW